MRKILIGLILCCVLIGCESAPEKEEVDVREWDDGTKVAVIKDDDGSEILMDYAIFMMLMNQGNSYQSIREYHHHHYQTSPDYRNRMQHIRNNPAPARTTVKQPISSKSSTSTKPSTGTSTYKSAPRSSAPSRSTSSSSSGKK